MRAIWATRGHTWGFRFLLNGGYADPLPAYERVFYGYEDEPSLCRRVGGEVALRFPDPLDRRDAAGRVIPHDFVILDPQADEELLAEEINSIDDGLQKVWPKVSEVFALVWDRPTPPDSATIRAAIERNSGNPPSTAGT